MLTPEQDYTMQNIVIRDSSACDTLLICGKDAKEVIRIANDGGIYWNGREVETDEDFKAAMLEMREYLMGMTLC